MAEKFLLNMRLDPQLLEVVDESATAADINRSDWIRAAIVMKLFADCHDDIDQFRHLVTKLKSTNTFKHVPDQMITFFENMSQDQIEHLEQMPAKDIPSEVMAEMNPSHTNEEQAQLLGNTPTDQRRGEPGSDVES